MGAAGGCAAVERHGRRRADGSDGLPSVDRRMVYTVPRRASTGFETWTYYQWGQLTDTPLP